MRHADLARALPLAEFVDSDLLVNWIRIVKSPAELSLMRQAGRIADAAIQRAVDTIEPGVRECDLAAAIYHQQVSGTPEFGGSYDCSQLMLGVGGRALEPHPAWTDEPLPASTTVYIEVHGNRLRYQVNLGRTISVGQPSPAYRELSDIAIEALNAGLESIRPRSHMFGGQCLLSAIARPTRPRERVEARLFHRNWLSARGR